MSGYNFVPTRPHTDKFSWSVVMLSLLLLGTLALHNRQLHHQLTTARDHELQLRQQWRGQPMSAIDKHPVKFWSTRLMNITQQLPPKAYLRQLRISRKRLMLVGRVHKALQARLFLQRLRALSWVRVGQLKKLQRKPTQQEYQFVLELRLNHD
ncbi:PilN domain-containing protein [Celerinatantimonas yamalensis]|uniref:PilN domain-containing protein n=1 Tax=Celerinatantimonas yamalensis TaxID=559956 RepID=A0ABW9G7S0_9GAMM